MAAASQRDALTVERPATVAVATAQGRASWFVRLVWLVLLAELSWALSAVTIAMLGIFSLLPVVIATAVLTAGLWHVTRGARAVADTIDRRARSWVRVAAVAGAGPGAGVDGGAAPARKANGGGGGADPAPAGGVVPGGGP